MAETLVQFTDPVLADDGTAYQARACGGLAPDGLWQGWIEFVPLGGGEVRRSGRETTQPNRQDALYWATGLTAVYLEGALRRALKPLARPAPPVIEPPAYDEPASGDVEAPAAESVLNPFSVYRHGEELLRNRLAALSTWHLVNVVRAYGLSDQSQGVLSAMAAPDLIDLIVAAVRIRAELPIR